MAHCVVSAIVDTDDGNAIVPACVVHIHYAPCPFDGEPACPTPLHALPGMATRSEALRMWRIKTHNQRPLVIHRQDGRDVEDHDDSAEGARCSCGPEVLEAEGA